MVRFKFYNVWVHGTFINELAFRLLGGINRDSNGNLHDVAGYVKNPDFTVSAPPHNLILDPLRRIAISGMDQTPDDSPQAKDYERQVTTLLQIIDKSVTGSAILQSVARDKKVIIVPYNSFDALSQGECNAATRNKASFGNYIRVAFTPDSACSAGNPDFPSSEDETLLHELFHAFLISVGKDIDYYAKMKESSSQEEFLAVQVTNMYRAEMGRGVFQRVYGAGEQTTKPPYIVSRKELEDYLQSDEGVLNVLNPGDVTLFLTLAKHAELPFNPFRNWGTYQQNLFKRRYQIQQDLQKGRKGVNPIPTPFWQ